MKKGRWKFWIGWAVGLIFFGLLLHFLGWRELGESLSQVKGPLFLGSFALLLLSEGVVLCKWFGLIQFLRMRLAGRELLSFFLSAQLGGMLTPGRVGEFASVALLPRLRGPFFSVIVLNRLVEGLVTLSLILFVFTQLLRSRLGIGAEGLALVLACLFLGFLILFWSPRGALLLWRRLKSRGGGRRYRSFFFETFRFYQVLRQLGEWRIVLFLVLISYFNWGIILFSNWVFFQAVGIGSISPWTVLSFMAVQLAGGFLAPTPAGLGFADIPPVYFLRSLGYTEHLGAFVLLGRFQMMVLMLCFYLLFLSLRSVSKARVSQHAAA